MNESTKKGTTALKRTAFYNYHLEHDGQMVDFAGWEMPIRYSSIHEEHHTVRNGAGIFDVSHMGRLKFTGLHARRFLERMLTRRISDMKPNTCRYALICNEDGGVLDDVILYRFTDQWMLVVNASNREKIIAHFQGHIGDMKVKMEDQTESIAMVAIQGPKVMELIGDYSKEIPTLKRYSFCEKNLLILKLVFSRTGYTGEDGVEVMLSARMASQAIKMLLKDKGDVESQIRPAGLGARDTLRMEAGMPLYGHELSEQIDPLTAGLGWAVSLDKDQDTDYGEPERFIGQDALRKISEQGVTKKLIGLKLDGRRTARQGAKVSLGDQVVGEVTSGCLSPTLGYPIAMAYVSPEHSEEGTSLTVEVGKSGADALVVPMPFYKRPK